VAAVLDASAVLAYLNREAGAELVADLLAVRASVSAVNLAEVLSTGADRGVAPEQLIARLANVGILDGALSVEPFTAEDASTVGSLRLATRRAGLSLGDRACLALARRLDAPAVTADTAWSELDAGVEIRLVRE
jgi:PIN domain nuclease of toxin-antitoxin system